MRKKIFKSNILYIFSLVVNLIIIFFLAINFKEEYGLNIKNRNFQNVEFFYFFSILIFLFINVLSLISLIFNMKRTILIIRLNLSLIIVFFLFKLSQVNILTTQNSDIEREDFVTFFLFILFSVGYFYFVEKFKYKDVYNEIEEIGKHND
jgi:hypothetical protein